MLGKQLRDLLLDMDKAGWRGLEKWLQSPAHNTDDSLVALLDHLRASAPELPKDEWEKGKLWRAMYGDKPLKQGVLRVKLRQLTQLVESFRVWEELAKDQPQFERLLLRSLARESSFSIFERESKRRIKQLDRRHATPDLDYFYQRAVLHYQLISHPQFDDYQTDGSQLVATNESVDGFFLLLKYRLGLEFKNRERILGEAHEVRFWGALEEAYAEGFLRDNPVARLYHDLFTLLNEPADHARFERFKFTLRDKLTQLGPLDRSNLYYTALNYLGRRINEGDSRYYAEMLEWYQLGLVDGLLLADKRLSDITYNNIALLGFQTGAFEWTRDFMETYAEYLDPSVRDDAWTAGLGLGYFYEGNFEQAIATLSAHRFSTTYQLRVRLTVIRSLYELLLARADVIDQLERTMSAFETYMKRNHTFSEATLAPYRQFLRLLRGLLQRQLSPSSDQETREWLEAELAKEGRVIAKDWLREKVQSA